MNLFNNYFFLGAAGFAFSCFFFGVEAGLAFPPVCFVAIVTHDLSKLKVCEKPIQNKILAKI